MQAPLRNSLVWLKQNIYITKEYWEKLLERTVHFNHLSSELSPLKSGIMLMPLEVRSISCILVFNILLHVFLISERKGEE